MTAHRDPGSFRDPRGCVFVDSGRILRAIFEPGRSDYTAARDAGIYDQAEQAGLLLPARQMPPDSVEIDAQGSKPFALLEHPRIPFISYPYEWSFLQLRAAALHQLELHLFLLERGFTLSDASAYNVQFVGTGPTFIDHLSILPYELGALWAGHRQFCMHFLDPLLLWSRRGISPRAWLRGSIDGISPEELEPLLKLRDKLSPTVLLHVVAQSRLQRRLLDKAVGVPSRAPKRKSGLSKNSLVAMLRSLHEFIALMRPPSDPSAWSSYADDNSYSDDDAERKQAFVRETVADIAPEMLVDVGCNSGFYSNLALSAGANYVVGLDTDVNVVAMAYDRFVAETVSSQALPLCVDMVDPSPNNGFGGRERASFGDRAEFDALLALAVVHHMILGRNVPMKDAVDCLVELAPAGIIEFPQRDDPMVQVLMADREHLFPDYEESRFLSVLGSRARVVDQLRLSDHGRLMVRYETDAMAVKVGSGPQAR